MLDTLLTRSKKKKKNFANESIPELGGAWGGRRIIGTKTSRKK